MGHSPNTYNTEKNLAIADRIWDMRTLKGMSQTQIAVELGISQAAVSKRLKKITAEYARVHFQKLDYYKTLQVKDLERVAEQAWWGWLESKKPKVVRRTHQYMPNGADEPIETESFEHRAGEGNPKFLSEYRAALAEIREILGINGALPFEYGNKSDDDKQAAIGRFLDGLSTAATPTPTTTIN